MRKEVFDKTDFAKAVYDIVRLIPEGRVTTYGYIAECIRGRGYARHVGHALKALAPDVKNIPAHRVVNSNGELSGKQYFDTIEEMQLRLEKEGVKVTGNRVASFKTVLWHPNEILRTF